MSIIEKLNKKLERAKNRLNFRQAIEMSIKRSRHEDEEIRQKIREVNIKTFGESFYKVKDKKQN